jgi:DNA repair photolyase
MAKKISGTKEWSEHSANFMKGCPNACVYCYASANAIGRWKRVILGDWSNPVFNEKSFNKKWGKVKGIIMFPTTHDIYPENLDRSIDFLKRLLEPGNDVLIVSKPHPKCIIKICRELKEYKKQILFRFTIGSGNNNVLKYWEPNAPTLSQRGISLMKAYDEGFKTSVSCEPMLGDFWDIKNMVKDLLPYVTDAIWLGKMNQLEKRLNANGFDINLIPNHIISGINHWENDDNIWTLYYRFKEDPKIKWKESIKKIVGIEPPKEKGLDI